MGRSTAKRPRPSAGPIRSLPGVVEGCGRRRCVTYPPCRSVSGFWLWFLVLCLCLGPAGAVGEGAVARCASSNHGPTLLAAGAAAALYALSSAPLVQRGANAPLVPGGLLSPIGRLEMEGDRQLPELPQYRSAIDLAAYKVTLPAVDRKHLADVGALTGSCTRSCYCFDSTQVEGELHVRWLPCGCPNCCSFNGSECEHRGEVGVPSKQVVAEASQAGYGARYTYRIAETNRLADEAKVDDFVAVAPPNGHTDDFWIARVMREAAVAHEKIAG